MDAYGSNFSLARQVAALAPAHGDAIIMPVKPTHVNTERPADLQGGGRQRRHRAAAAALHDRHAGEKRARLGA